MARSSSEVILTGLMDSLKSHLKQNLPQRLADRLLFEFYNVPFYELESDKRIGFARIALYELDESVTDYVGPRKPNMSDQAYGLDISVVRGYVGDNANRGEFPALLLRDHIIDWAKGVDAGLVTEQYIYYFSYVANTQFERNDRLVNRTLNFTAQRDLQKPQIL